MEALDAIGRRFAGIDVQFRRFWEVHWPAPWRVRLLTSKNERAKYRLTAYGATFADAAQGLADAVAAADAQREVTP